VYGTLRFWHRSAAGHEYHWLAISFFSEIRE
jgi:hypothetical protein